MLAAAGRELSAAELSAAYLNLALTDRDAAEAAVLDTGLVVRVRGGLRFRHALLAEAVRADLGEQGRRYEQLALAIEAAAPAPDRVAAEVAGHLHRAGRDDLAGPALAAGGPARPGRWARCRRRPGSGPRRCGATPKPRTSGWSWLRPSAGSARMPTSSASGRRPLSSSRGTAVGGLVPPRPGAPHDSVATPGRRSPPTSGPPSSCLRTRRRGCGWTSCSVPPGASRRPVIQLGPPRCWTRWPRWSPSPMTGSWPRWPTPS